MSDKINLFVNYYDCGNKERQKELDFCKESHASCGYFDEIIVFDDRPMYNDFFRKTADYPNDINILCNSDIYFNETILKAKELKEKEAYALTRWEWYNDNVVQFESRNRGARAMHSQDVWIFRGYASGINGDFHIGVAGCDNRIAYEIVQGKYYLTNPYKEIKCIHRHKSELRDYTIKDKIRPPYIWVDYELGAITPGHYAAQKRRRNV